MSPSGTAEKGFQRAGSQIAFKRRIGARPILSNRGREKFIRLARERGYLVTDEDLLFLAWNEYRRAAAALVDVRLQTKEYSYADALNFLVTENGFEQEEAETLLKDISAHPAESLSYIYGLRTIEQTRSRYAKKMGKEFNLSDFHRFILQIGNVPMDMLSKEIDRAQKKK